MNQQVVFDTADKSPKSVHFQVLKWLHNHNIMTVGLGLPPAK